MRAADPSSFALSTYSRLSARRSTARSMKARARTGCDVRLLLGERVTWTMVAGCAVILLSTSLAIGLVRPVALESPKVAP